MNMYLFYYNIKLTVNTVRLQQMFNMQNSKCRFYSAMCVATIFPFYIYIPDIEPRMYELRSSYRGWRVGVKFKLGLLRSVSHKYIWVKSESFCTLPVQFEVNRRQTLKFLCSTLSWQLHPVKS